MRRAVESHHMPETSVAAHNKSWVVMMRLPSPMEPAPLVVAEARVTQVEVELRLRLAEALLSELEAERDQLNAELAEDPWPGTSVSVARWRRMANGDDQSSGISVQHRAEVRLERDAWKVVATRLLLAPKRSWWSFLAGGR
jgi:hypothetical protein